MNQSQFLVITCNSLEARENSRVHGAIGFGFASHWLKNWRESLKPITKRSNRDHEIYVRQSFENCSSSSWEQDQIPSKWKAITGRNFSGSFLNSVPYAVYIKPTIFFLSNRY